VDGIYPDHVSGLALDPRFEINSGYLCTLIVIVNVMRSTRDNYHPSLVGFRIELIGLQVDVVLGAGDSSTQVLFSEERPVSEEDNRAFEDLILKREGEPPPADCFRTGS